MELSRWIHQDPPFQKIYSFLEGNHSSDLWCNRWEVITLHLTHYVYTYFFAYVLKGLIWSTHTVGLKSLSRRLHLIDLHLASIASKIDALNRWPRHLIQLATNHPHIDTQVLGILEQTLYSEIPSFEVKKWFYPPLEPLEPIIGKHQTGTCRGMCFWFVYLYLKTQAAFDDPGRHIEAVASAFIGGAPEQATLLQVISDVESFLGIESHFQIMSTSHFKKRSIVFLKWQPGIYSIGVGKHRINYIKINKTCSYLFDPNIGVLCFRAGEIHLAHQYICRLIQRFCFENKTTNLLISHCSKII